jgi:hypothetical protein
MLTPGRQYTEAGTTFFATDQDASSQGYRLIVSPLYQTDRVNHTRTIGGDVFFTPTVIKSWPASERLSDYQLELLEQEPGVSEAEVEAESERAQLLIKR